MMGSMEWVLEPFDLEFMQRALLAGMLAVVASSVVGTWVVLRGLSFLGDALAHGVIPGMALAVLWGFNLTVGRSEEHTSELQSLMRISYAVFCLKKKTKRN